MPSTVPEQQCRVLTGSAELVRAALSFWPPLTLLLTSPVFFARPRPSPAHDPLSPNKRHEKDLCRDEAEDKGKI